MLFFILLGIIPFLGSWSRTTAGDIDDAELKGLKLEGRHGIERDIVEDEGPFKEGVGRVSYISKSKRKHIQDDSKGI